jgi:protein TonB
VFFFRYLLSVIFSFLIHSLAFSSAPPPSLNLDLNATQKSSIAIQFVAPKKEYITKENTKKTPKEIISEPEKVTKAVKKQINMTEKNDNKAFIKPLKNRLKEVKKTVKDEPKSKLITEKLAKNEPKKELDEKPKKRQKTEKPIPTTTASSNKPSAPKMVKKVTFSARPSPIDYPHSAKRRNIEGLVLVEVWLDEKGKQIKQRIINSSGHQILDKAALKGISQWQFSRQQDDGQAIAYRVQVPINFGLN